MMLSNHLILNLVKVQYTLIATINRKPKRKKNLIEVIVPLCKWSIPTDQEIRSLVIKSHARNRKVSISWQAILPQTFFDMNSEVLIKLTLTSHDPDLCVHKISTCLKTFVQYFVDGHPEERHKLHSKNIVYGKDILMTPIGTNTVFEANTMIKIPSNVPPTCKTKYMLIKNQIQIKVSFKRLRHSVMITKDIIVGRNFLDDKSAAERFYKFVF
jgi:Arrestin (or S-antigen), C-terminal domain